MTQATPFKLPLQLLLLDWVGAVLLGLGLAEEFAGVDILNGVLDFAYRPYVLMVAGTLMMLPMLLFILNAARSRAEGRVMK